MNELAFANPEIVKYYVKFRPSPPANLAKAVVEYLRQGQDEGDINMKLCVDVGCGSGQSTALYADYFQQVIGLDISPHQVAAAKTKNTVANVVYKEGSAHSLPFEDASVDLITCCNAFHWFNIEAFFAEVRRVLRPGGVLACYSCWYPQTFYNDKDLTYIIDELWDSWKEIGFQSFHHFLNDCTEVPDLYQEQVTIRKAEGKFQVEREETVEAYMDYYLSNAICQEARNKYGHQHTDKVLNSVKQRIMDAMGTKNEQQKLRVLYQYFLRMWRKPSC